MKKLLIFSIVMLGIIASYSPLFGIYHKIGDYNSGDRTLSLDIKDEIMYTAKNTGLIEVFDINDPEQPQLIGNCQIPDVILGGWNQIIVSDSLAFVLTFSDGIKIINISNPNEPKIIGSYNYNNANDLVISDNYAYIADYNDLYILDISEILSPVVIGEIYGKFWDITLFNNKIYGIRNSLRIIDVSNPSDPETLGSLSLPLSSCGGIEIKDFIAYIANSGSLWSINIEDPSNPFILDTIEITNHANRIVIKENKAIVNNSSSGFEVIDISDPSNLSEISFFDTPGLAEQIKIIDDIVYVADCYSGIQIIDISDPSTPNLLSRFHTISRATGLDLKDDYLYVGDDYIGLDVVSISDVYNPNQIGTVSLYPFGGATSVSILNDIAYCCTGYQVCSVNFVDISHPIHPFLIDSLYVDGFMTAVGCVNNSNMFVGSDYGNLQIFDGTNLISEYVSSNEIINLSATEDYVYLAEGDHGIEIIDISDINDPVLSGSYDTNGYAYNAIAKDDIMYVSDEEQGIQIIDVADPQNPTYISSIKPHDNSDVCANSLIIYNSLIFFDKEWNELFVYNIGNPSEPTYNSSFQWNSTMNEILIDNNTLFSADAYYGVSIINILEYLSTGGGHVHPIISSSSNFPNPFKHTMMIEFSLKSSANIELSIYNIKGQKIKTFTENEFTEGSHSIVWNGNDKNNKPVASGIYFYKLDANGRTEVVNKCMLLK